MKIAIEMNPNVEFVAKKLTVHSFFISLAMCHEKNYYMNCVSISIPVKILLYY